jgi:7-carboxy-7-deazaguanine synthase
MKYVSINEVFSSIQGEGPWIGERHIFVRFLGCDIHCRYCDTPAALPSGTEGLGSKICMAQTAAGADTYDQIENPVSSHALLEFCSRLIIPGPSRPTLSLTGGEPLLHRDFLMEWLGHARRQFRVYLETNGVHAEVMQELRDLVDVISMDFKLPSATGLRPFWQEHKDFLAAAKGKVLFVKAVVTKDAAQEDILTSARIIAGFDQRIPLVIQPAGGELAPGSNMLVDFQNAALKIIPDVRVIPQIHKILNVP